MLGNIGPVTKYLMFFLALAMSIGLVQANDVFYEINETSTYYNVSSTVQLECDADNPGCPTPRWSLSWNLPENSEVQTVKDQYGEVEEYQRVGNVLEVETNTGYRANNQTVEINYQVFDHREDMLEGLERRELNLPGYSDSKTSGIIDSENLISGTSSHDSKIMFEHEQISFETTGPISLRLNSGDGREIEGFSYFGDYEASKNISRLAMGSAVGVTHRKPVYNSLPVVVVEPRVYDYEVGGWSAGQYESGIVTLRGDLDERFASILTHETVHAINHEVLEWDNTGTAYIDEGLAEYAEFLVDKRLYREGKVDRAPAEIFGESIEYTERQGGDIVRYTVPSNGDKEDLWDYYQQDEEFVKYWHPNQEENREFGYAYSQLIIRNHIKEGGSLDSLYEDLESINEVIESEERKTEKLEEFMDLEPCKTQNRDQFESCLEGINDYEFDIVFAENIDDVSQNESLEVDSIELEERERSKGAFEDERLFNLLIATQEIISRVEVFLQEMRHQYL